MPRPNPHRTRTEERHVASYLAQERERRGWSQGAVAKRMTRAGCPIAPTAVHKIEREEDPRRITVDELAALSEILNVPVDVLMGSAPGDPGHRGEAELLKAKIQVVESLLVEHLKAYTSDQARLRRLTGSLRPDLIIETDEGPITYGIKVPADG